MTPKNDVRTTCDLTWKRTCASHVDPLQSPQHIIHSSVFLSLGRNSKSEANGAGKCWIILQLGSGLLPWVKGFKYVDVLFVTEGRMEDWFSFYSDEPEGKDLSLHQELWLVTKEWDRGCWDSPIWTGWGVRTSGGCSEWNHRGRLRTPPDTSDWKETTGKTEVKFAIYKKYWGKMNISS